MSCSAIAPTVRPLEKLTICGCDVWIYQSTHFGTEGGITQIELLASLYQSRSCPHESTLIEPACLPSRLSHTVSETCLRSNTIALLLVYIMALAPLSTTQRVTKRPQSSSQRTSLFGLRRLNSIHRFSLASHHNLESSGAPQRFAPVLVPKIRSVLPAVSSFATIASSRPSPIPTVAKVKCSTGGKTKTTTIQPSTTRCASWMVREGGVVQTNQATRVQSHKLKRRLPYMNNDNSSR